jgi:hypothetical protein
VGDILRARKAGPDEGKPVSVNIPSSVATSIHRMATSLPIESTGIIAGVTSKADSTRRVKPASRTGGNLHGRVSSDDAYRMTFLSNYMVNDNIPVACALRQALGTS